jgi:2-methylcitrate dehydratase
MQKQADSVQEQLTNFACGLGYSDLTPEAIHSAKVRLTDVLGALMAGYFAPSSMISRNLAARSPSTDGATVLGTRFKAVLPTAVFANATTARYVEMTDTGLLGGHPSDVVMPLFSVAEYAHASGRQLITALVMAYEIYISLQPRFHNRGFDHTNFASLATATAAGPLLGLNRDQIAHCISMTVVPNNGLRVARRGHLSMWKVAASGQAAQAAVFAALLSRAGMEGPHLPFEGKSGWLDHVATERFSLDGLGARGAPFKILEACAKMRPCGALAIPSVLAAEKISPVANLERVREVTVETFKKARDTNGSAHLWNPDSKETADHSIPYLVAAVLMDGRLTLRAFRDDRLWNPALRTLMPKIKVTEDADFTRAHAGSPQQNRARITVVLQSGERLTAESGGDENDLASPKSDAQMAKKFREATEELLGARRVSEMLSQLERLEAIDDVAAIPPQWVIA